MEKKLKISYVRPDQLKSYDRALKKQSEEQIVKTVHILEKFGHVQPLIVDKDDVVVLGTHLYEASVRMEMKEVPIVRLEGLSEEDVRIIRLAYQRIAEEADWDEEALKLEFEELQILLPELDLTLTGFDIPELDMIINFVPDKEQDPDDFLPDTKNVKQKVALGDLWMLGDHLLYCGDALKEESYEFLLGQDKVNMVFTDAPYNVKINGHVGNSGKIKHEEFAMASGEMNDDEFIQFLKRAHENMTDVCKDGAIIFSCMDWRHMDHMLRALSDCGLTLKNLCVWNKGKGGMGSLYRSQHELVFVAKKGKEKHINNVQLGMYGRYRTNVWDYPGVTGNDSERREELKLHPTVKPIQMVADAMLDCSGIGDIILDPFGGAGTTLLAAERVRRKARMIELSPRYCDLILERWEKMTGRKAQKIETTYINQEELKEVGNE